MNIGLDELTQSAPIASIQRGAWVYSSLSSTDITITAVDLSKSVVIVSNKSSQGNENSYSTGGNAGGELTTTTNLHLDAGRLGQNSTTTNTGICYWQVIEYI